MSGRSSLIPKLALGYAVAFALCPKRESFNTRAQVKAVVGQQLRLQQRDSKVASQKESPSLWERSASAFLSGAATETAAAAMALSAGEASMNSLLGAAWLVEVPMPDGKHLYWIGCFIQWIYIGEQLFIELAVTGTVCNEL